MREKERIETERRRTMTDAEVVAENERIHGPQKEKAPVKFLQKYYHKVFGLPSLISPDREHFLLTMRAKF